MALDPDREVIDPTLLGIYARLMTVLQNALRRDTYVGLDTIAVVCEAIASDCRYNIWVLSVVKKHATAEQFIVLLEQYHSLTTLCAAAVIKFHGDHDKKSFQTAIRDVATRIDKIPKTETFEAS
jgi:hypothetical protein